jgi:hypothetical protein
MSHKTATVERELLHTRRIELRGYRRADGFYDIEGHLRDTKSYDRTSNGVVRRAGDAIHEMRLRITIGTDMVIADAHAESDVVPYPAFCDSITPEYKKLIGMTLKAGFTRETRALFGGVNGCTHLTELIGSVATAAFQTMSEEINERKADQPFQIDGCHALRGDGQVVQKFYPKWFPQARTRE